MLNELIEKIIEEQSLIIGKNLSRSRASMSGGISFPEKGQNKVEITSDPTTTLDNLVSSYTEIFGRASEDVCLDVIRKFPYEEIEQYLPDRIKQQVNPNALS